MDEWAIEEQAKTLRFNWKRLDNVLGENPDEWGSATEREKNWCRSIIRTMRENEILRNGGFVHRQPITEPRPSGFLRALSWLRSLLR